MRWPVLILTVAHDLYTLYHTHALLRPPNAIQAFRPPASIYIRNQFQVSYSLMRPNFCRRSFVSYQCWYVGWCPCRRKSRLLPNVSSVSASPCRCRRVDRSGRWSAQSSWSLLGPSLLAGLGVFLSDDLSKSWHREMSPRIREGTQKIERHISIRWRINLTVMKESLAHTSRRDSVVCKCCNIVTADDFGWVIIISLFVNHSRTVDLGQIPPTTVFLSDEQ